jgi:hypothetical protein
VLLLLAENNFLCFVCAKFYIVVVVVRLLMNKTRRDRHFLIRPTPSNATQQTVYISGPLLYCFIRCIIATKGKTVHPPPPPPPSYQDTTLSFRDYRTLPSFVVVVVVVVIVLSHKNQRSLSADKTINEQIPTTRHTIYILIYHHNIIFPFCQKTK